MFIPCRKHTEPLEKRFKDMSSHYSFYRDSGEKLKSLCNEIKNDRLEEIPEPVKSNLIQLYEQVQKYLFEVTSSAKNESNSFQLNLAHLESLFVRCFEIKNEVDNSLTANIKQEFRELFNRIIDTKGQWVTTLVVKFQIF